MRRVILSVESQAIATGLVILLFVVLKPNLGIDIYQSPSFPSFDISQDLKNVSIDKENKNTKVDKLAEISPKPTLIPLIASSTFNVNKVSEFEKTGELSPTKVPIEPTKAPQPTIRIETNTVVAPEEINVLIEQYAKEFNVNASKMKTIAKCESGFNPDAKSPSGTYVGLYQFHPSTWISNRNAMGLDPDPRLRTNSQEAVKTAAFKMARDGFGAWPVCGKI